MIYSEDSMHRALATFFSDYRKMALEPNIELIIELLADKRDVYADSDEMGDCQEFFNDI